MTVYILYDDCPDWFSVANTIMVFSNKTKAQWVMKALQRKDSFQYQYLKVISKRVK